MRTWEKKTERCLNKKEENFTKKTKCTSYYYEQKKMAKLITSWQAPKYVCPILGLFISLYL